MKTCYMLFSSSERQPTTNWSLSSTNIQTGWLLYNRIPHAAPPRVVTPMPPHPPHTPLRVIPTNATPAPTNTPAYMGPSTTLRHPQTLNNHKQSNLYFLKAAIRLRIITPVTTTTYKHLSRISSREGVLMNNAIAVYSHWVG